MAITDLANDIFTNNIEFVSKQLQTFVDFLFPDNEDNSTTDIQGSDLGVMIEGTVYNNFGDFGYNYVIHSLTAYYHFSLTPNTTTENLMTYLAPRFPDGLDSNGTDLYLSALENAVNAADFTLRKTNGDSVITFDTANTLLISGNNYRPWKYYGNYVNGNTFEKNNLNLYLSRSDSQSLALKSGNSYSYETVRLIPEAKNILLGNDLQRISDSNTEYTVNLSDGDTINYYIDNGGSVYVDIEPDLSFNYNDLKLVFDDLLGNLGFDISFPTYDEIKYADMGDFYIRPIEQINKLPVAPDISEMSVDVGDYVTLLGGSINSFIDFTDALGITSIFVMSFVACLLIGHLKR